MSLEGLIAEVQGALARAHSLFGTPPESGGAAAAADSTATAAAETRNTGGKTAAMSGHWVQGHGAFVDNHAPALDGIGNNYRQLNTLLGDAASTDRAGHADSGAVVSGAHDDTAALAPTTNTPAGQKALVAALARRVAQQRRILGVYQARDTQLQSAIRSLTLRQGAAPMSGFGTPMSGGGTPMSGGGAPMDMPLSPPIPSAFTPGARGSNPSPATGFDAARAAALPQDAGSRAAAAALAQRGTPYVWGGQTPGRGFDCSGLTQYAWRQAGVGLPRDTYGQISQGHPVPRGQVRAGDLIFPSSAFGENGRPGPGHVMMAISPTECVEAQQSGVPVKISPMPAAYVARRPIPS